MSRSVVAVVNKNLCKAETRAVGKTVCGSNIKSVIRRDAWICAPSLFSEKLTKVAIAAPVSQYTRMSNVFNRSPSSALFHQVKIVDGAMRRFDQVICLAVVVNNCWVASWGATDGRSGLSAMVKVEQSFPTPEKQQVQLVSEECAKVNRYTVNRRFSLCTPCLGCCCGREHRQRKSRRVGKGPRRHRLLPKPHHLNLTTGRHSTRSRKGLEHINFQCLGIYQGIVGSKWHRFAQLMCFNQPTTDTCLESTQNPCCTQYSRLEPHPPDQFGREWLVHSASPSLCPTFLLGLHHPLPPGFRNSILVRAHWSPYLCAIWRWSRAEARRRGPRGQRTD